MGNIHSQNSNHVVWSLKSEYAPTLRLDQEPDGWDDEDYELTRHKTYHGMFISFSNSLVFRKESIEYIKLAYQLGGVNTNMYLTRHKLKDVDGDIKYVQDYFGLADFSTMVEKQNGIELSFNSNELEELMKSHEADSFEIERYYSIDDTYIGQAELHKIKLEGRTITAGGEQDVDLDQNTAVIGTKTYQRIPVREVGVDTFGYSNMLSRLIAEGDKRFVKTDLNSTLLMLGSDNMFYNREQDDQSVIINLEFVYDIKGFFKYTVPPQADNVFAKIAIVKAEYDIDTTLHTQTSITNLWTQTIETWRPKDADFPFEFQGRHTIKELKANESVAIVMYIESNVDGQNTTGSFYIEKHNIRSFSSPYYEASTNLTFTFFHDTLDRLMKIITGDEGRFYSNYFGRTEAGYEVDGFGGLIGLMSGFWVRAFDRSSAKYKSLQISLKDALASAQAVFNVGIGVETFELKQRLRVEELEYFYQNTVSVRLPIQINDVVRKVDKQLFFSGTEFGYEYGGEYDSDIGLDEPNIKTYSTTPIRKSNLKYRRVSKIRSDETGLELARRNPQAESSDKDTAQDSHNWFLDLKRSWGSGYEQTAWEDRLVSEPTGVTQAENYKSMIFTPLRMLLRHGFILRSGLEPYLSKYIKYSKSESNTTLTTHTIGEASPYKENDDVMVRDLDRSRFLPEVITFKHAVSDELMDLIKGSTRIFYNGKYETIPNVYFKFEWINELQELESGYLLSMKPKGEGSFTFQKANENIII
jgi:hypothetical protein